MINARERRIWNVQGKIRCRGVVQDIHTHSHPHPYIHTHAHTRTGHIHTHTHTRTTHAKGTKRMQLLALLLVDGDLVEARRERRDHNVHVVELRRDRVRPVLVRRLIPDLCEGRGEMRWNCIPSNVDVATFWRGDI